MPTCKRCGRAVEASFRFCPGCGEARRLKIVEHFLGVGDLGDGALRVSIYMTEPQHVRLSLWRENAVRATISLSPVEARRLGDFLSRLHECRPADLPDVVRRSARTIHDTRPNAG